METSRRPCKHLCKESCFENDWPEATNFWRTTKRFLKKTIRVIKLHVSLNDVERNQNMLYPLVNLTLVKDSVMVVGKNEELLLYFLKNGLKLPFLGKDLSRQGLLPTY